MSVLLWLRNDLRLADNPALQRAANLAQSNNLPLIIAFIEDAPNPSAKKTFTLPTVASPQWGNVSQGLKLGGASRWWLHHSLASFEKSVHALGQTLLLAQGNPVEHLLAWVATYGVRHVVTSYGVEPHHKNQVQALEKALAQYSGGAVWLETVPPNYWLPLDAIHNNQGGVFKVYSPFYKKVLTQLPGIEVLPAPTQLPPPPQGLQAAALAQLQLLPARPWDSVMTQWWQPGEVGAQKRTTNFLAEACGAYHTERDRPDHTGTSRLSPHLHFGEISPRQIVRAMVDAGLLAWPIEKPTKGAEHFFKEVMWREFAGYVLHHFPHTDWAPFRPEFSEFPFVTDTEALQRWREGQTGYPIVDAGMRELWATGWMHNRVRMIVASFLVKHLQQDWRHGAEWFWDTLVDADLASNSLGWQWSAGCGVDAAPYFRVFNPILQGKKFDPLGDYVRRWVPELAKLPADWIHEPWMAPPLTLYQAGMTLGDAYPAPMVDHPTARKKALAAFAQLRGTAPADERALSRDA